MLGQLPFRPQLNTVYAVEASKPTNSDSQSTSNSSESNSETSGGSTGKSNSTSQNNASTSEPAQSNETTKPKETTKTEKPKTPKKNVKKTPPPKTDETVKTNTQNTEEQPKINLPDISDYQNEEALNDIVSAQNQTNEKLIKGIIAWVLILSGISLIIWVIFKNRKIPRHDYMMNRRRRPKVNRKHQLNYKNLRRK